MIHCGKVPNEDKIIIEVSGKDLLHLRNMLDAGSLPERRVFNDVKVVLEQEKSLHKYIEPLM